MKVSALIPVGLRLAARPSPPVLSSYELDPPREVSHVTQLARVLLVDDSRGDVLLAQRQLTAPRGLDCELSVARTAAEAMDVLVTAAAHRRPIDLILLDIGLPGENGFSLLDRIRAHPRLAHTPVIMCTGSHDDSDRRHARFLGVIGYVTKPPSADQLKNLADLLPRLDVVEDEAGMRLTVTRTVTN